MFPLIRLLILASAQLVAGTVVAATFIPTDEQCVRNFLTKQYGEAFSACRSAAEIRPSYINQVNLGVMRLYGWGASKDIDAAIQLFDKAAQLGGGDGTAEHNLGYAYETGTSVKRDRVKAIALYRRAAQSGHEGSQYNLAIAYFEGSGVPVDHATGYAWLLVAERSGSKEAQAALHQISAQVSTEDKARGRSKSQELLKSLPLSRDERTKRLIAEILEISR